MKPLMTFIAAAWIGLSAPLQAENLVVVELFTSQGCSSCPPADALFHSLAERDDVIAISMHVDYWDYIGWKDEFADPKHAKRQRAYALEAGRRSIYTPQMVVNGKTDIVGTRPMELSKAISAYQRMPVVDVELARAGDDVVITADPTDLFEGPFVMYLVRYEPLREARITRGENAGHTLNYSNVAEGLMVLGEWDGVTPLNVSIAAPGPKPLAVLLHQGPAGQIVGAQRLR